MLKRRPIASTIIALAAVISSAGPVQASSDNSFYETPTALPARNGDVIRNEPASFYLDPARLVRVPAKVNRVLYRSTDRRGAPVAVSGTVLTPLTPWIGLGPRPVVAYNLGTQGLGDACAPSRQMTAGTEYEGVFLSGLLGRGYGVVVTDYQGLGTGGLHSYLDREATGRAVLDGIRAAQRLDVAGLPDAGPVGIAGYSQGGQASAAAAELAPTYAPELKVKGVAAGAVPADLKPLLALNDGKLLGSLIGYGIQGLSDSYGIEVDTLLNDRGRQVLADLREACIVEAALTYPFMDSSTLTASGQRFSEITVGEPWDTVYREQTLGLRKPTAPVLVTQSLLDDVVAYDVAKGMVDRWCARGARVQFLANAVPTHAGAITASYPSALAFLEGRFAGLPAYSNCV